MSARKYEEPLLEYVIKLKVTKASWEMMHYFPGPDMRHNGTFVAVPGSSVGKYIFASNDNWVECEQLKSAIPSGRDSSKPGKMGMTIRIDSFAQGECIQWHHMPISSKQQLEKIISGYRYASQRASQIQPFSIFTP